MAEWFHLIQSRESGSYWESTPIDQIRLEDNRPPRDSIHEDKLVERLFQHYRANYGDRFPFDPLTEQSVSKDFARLKKSENCLDPHTGQIKQTMTGLHTANGFHPEMVNVRCRQFRTPMELYLDDELFKKALRKRIRFGDRSGELRVGGVRKMLYSYSGTQRVSNFRPTAAKAIYNFFQPRLALDFCAGWGGRLLGALASQTKYVGIDPNTLSVQGNQKMLDMVRKVTRQNYDATLIQGCAEDLLGKNTWRPDLIFTSPPYFDVEKYSDEPTQSYLRYPTVDSWYEQFLSVAIKGAYADLTDDGFMLLNVNPDMKDKTKEIAERHGFVWLADWDLMLSKNQFFTEDGVKSGFRSEPVLVFSKGEDLPLPANTLDLFSSD